MKSPESIDPFNEPLTYKREGWMMVHKNLPGSGKHIRVFRKESPEAELTPEQIERFNTAREHFMRLRDEYGIATPEIDHVIGHGATKEEENFYVVVDDIVGVPIESADYNPALEKAFDDFFAGMFRYYTDAYAKKDAFLNDIHAEQLRYGHKKDEAQDRLYVIDVDPVFVRAKEAKSEPGIYETKFGACVSLLETQLGIIAQRFSPPARFEAAHQALARLKEVAASGDGTKS